MNAVVISKSLQEALLLLGDYHRALKEEVECHVEYDDGARRLDELAVRSLRLAKDIQTELTADS